MTPKIDLRDPAVIATLKAEYVKNPITTVACSPVMTPDEQRLCELAWAGFNREAVKDMSNSSEPSRLPRDEIVRVWEIDGYAHQGTDIVKLATGSDDDYHPENVLRGFEFQLFRGGEIVKRMWWLR